MGSRGRTLSRLSRVRPDVFKLEGRPRDSIDSMALVDSTIASDEGVMDWEELPILSTAQVFS